MSYVLLLWMWRSLSLSVFLSAFNRFSVSLLNLKSPQSHRLPGLLWELRGKQRISDKYLPSLICFLLYVRITRTSTGFQWDLLSGVLQYEGSWEMCQHQHVFVVMSRQPGLAAPEPESHVAIRSRDGAHSVRGRQLRRPQGTDLIGYIPGEK